MPTTGKSPCPGPEPDMVLELIPHPMTRALGPFLRKPFKVNNAKIYSKTIEWEKLQLS